jgi:hypothetical protein
MAKKQNWQPAISIEVVQGGFILTYPVLEQEEGAEVMNMYREVFVSPRKLNQKIKEVIDGLSTVADEK